MFTVDIGNVTYKVFYRYGSHRPVHSRKDKRYTECVISGLVISDGLKQIGEKGKFVELNSYKEYCSTKDNFCKNRGRKLALAHLLKKLDFPKEVRVLFWEAYGNARGKIEVCEFEDGGKLELLVPRFT